jgi:hypothetical protein
MVNKMMLKMFAEFLGTSPEEIAQMIADGHNAIIQGLALMHRFDARLERIEKKLGITEPIDPVVIEAKGIEDGVTAEESSE